MHKIFILTFLFFQIVACKSQNNSPTETKTMLNSSELEAKIDLLARKYVDLDIFSGVVLVAEKGKLIYHKAFGLANRETNTSNTIDTKFDIGSMNKTFTKIVVLQLLEEKKIDLDDLLGKYLSGFPSEAANKITIDQLLNFTSGYGDYVTREYFDLPVSQKNIASLVERIKKLPLHFEPGTDNMYSNAGYILLGAIIEKITGKTYQQNVKERIVIPMELKETYVEGKNGVQDKSVGYSKTMTGEIEDNLGIVELPNPDGGFLSTALDNLKFYREFHYGNTLLKEETKQKDAFYRMIQEHSNTGGAIPFAGGYNGANTVNYEILRDKITVIVFANMNEPVAEQLGAGILAIIRNQTPKEPALPAIENVYQSFNKHGIEYIEKNFEGLTVNFHPSDPRDLILNQVGYGFLSMDKVDEALEIFLLNTKLFPEVGNIWDSLGEAYYTKGDKQMALSAYQRALSLDSEIPSARKMVKKLGG